MGERHERHVRMGRNRREQRRKRHVRRGEEPKKVPRLVTLEFGDYALVRWTQVLEDIRRGEKDPCEDWIALKRLMRHRRIMILKDDGEVEGESSNGEIKEELDPNRDLP
ncbi:hypothetical protein CR513_56297, partial [Mucuna pruriens]